MKRRLLLAAGACLVAAAAVWILPGPLSRWALDADDLPDGTELFRHEGFLAEGDVMTVLQRMGVR